MVLIDTSIWLSLYRKQESELAQKLWMLAARNEAAVSGQVWVEFWAGFANKRCEAGNRISCAPILFWKQRVRPTI